MLNFQLIFQKMFRQLKISRNSSLNVFCRRDKLFALSRNLFSTTYYTSQRFLQVSFSNSDRSRNRKFDAIPFMAFGIVVAHCLKGDDEIKGTIYGKHIYF